MSGKDEIKDESEILMEAWTEKMVKVRITKGDPPLASIYDFIAIAKGVKSGGHPWHQLLKNNPELNKIIKKKYIFGGTYFYTDKFLSSIFCTDEF